MNMKIKDSIAWAAFGAVMAIIMFPSCSDENEAGILEITNNEIILQAEGAPVQVEEVMFHLIVIFMEDWY